MSQDKDPRIDAMLQGAREGQICSIVLRRKLCWKPLRVMSCINDCRGYQVFLYGWAWLWFVVHYKTTRQVVPLAGPI